MAYARAARTQQTQPRKRQEGTLLRAAARLLLLLVLPTLIFAGALAYARHQTAPSLGPSTQGAVVWGDGEVLFKNTNEMAAWLRKHGGTFKDFKKKHPAAVQLVTSHAAAADVKVAASRTKSAPPKDRIAADPISTVSTTSNTTAVGLIAIGALGTFLLLLALAPTAVLERARILRPNAFADVRLMALAAALAIGAGLAVAFLL